jgi:hypothetical protein
VAFKAALNRVLHYNIGPDESPVLILADVRHRLFWISNVLIVANRTMARGPRLLPDQQLVDGGSRHFRARRGSAR